ncbi:methyltransferase family protein [Carboxylicivirga marina]|uniref:methyltransferase family protein n=1 Tax=Carboxylicivirga marina TaxID=2800988 RepID=UPI00259878DC|nr:isoprenylcysteine carboxylmethyltransferase family protein [uncultured Carboxylicivirga sp.]
MTPLTVSIIRIFLPCYFLFYLMILYYFNINSFKKKYKIDPEVVKTGDTVMYYLQVFRNFIFFLVLICILIFSIFPGLYFILAPVNYLEIEVTQYFGMLLMVISMIITRKAQIQLKTSWRIGIDRSNTKTELITDGLYSISRNPIALSMLSTVLGLFLVLPNALSFAILFLVYLIFSVRIRMEEEHLLKQHGQHYKEYQQKTRRWL